MSGGGEPGPATADPEDFVPAVTQLVGLLGFTPDQAWALTPCEMQTCMEAIRARRREQAWWTWWSIAPHITPESRPTIDQLAGEAAAEDTNRPMTADEWAEMRETFERAYPGRQFTWPSIRSS